MCCWRLHVQTCKPATQNKLEGPSTCWFFGTWDLQSQTKQLGHQASSPLPSLSVLIIRRFFLFLLEKNAIFSTIEYGGGGGGGGDGGYVIQLKCPN